jgi:hypothetical protein
VNDEEEEPGFLLDCEDSDAQRAAQQDTLMRIAGIVAHLEGIADTRELTHKEARQLEGWKTFLRRKEPGA